MVGKCSIAEGHKKGDWRHCAGGFRRQITTTSAVALMSFEECSAAGVLMRAARGSWLARMQTARLDEYRTWQLRG
jgi:hypothetical protein